jgi:hypothetical protein
MIQETSAFLGVVFTLTVAGNAAGQSQQQPMRSELPRSSRAAQAQQESGVRQRGTDDSPLVVKIQPDANNAAAIERDVKELDQKAINDRETIAINRRLVMLGNLQLVVFIGQLLVFGYQAYKLRETVNATVEQSRDMKASIAEATRSASAMEAVAGNAAISARMATESVATVRERTAQQMRAYVSVLVGGAVYQEREKNLRFEAKPVIVNAGHTPAHNVGYRARAAVLSVPLPEDFPFALPEKVIGAAVLGPQQNVVLSAIVDDYCDDRIVADVKKASGNALYAWGEVTYDDVFSERRRTRFCQIMTWLPDGQTWGYYAPVHNDAD